MKNVVVSMCALAVVGVAGAAMGAPFEFVGIDGHDADRTYSNVGLSTSGSGFFNPAGGLNTSLSSGDPFLWSESANSHRAYDSYFTVSPQGPSRLGSADDVGDTLSPQIRAFYGYADETVQSFPSLTAPGTHLGGTGDTDGQLPAPFFINANDFSIRYPFDFNRARGGWANNYPLTGSDPTPLSGINPINGRDAIFLAQFTVNRGARLSGAFDVTLAIRTSPTTSTESKFPLTIDGPANFVLTATNRRQFMVLRTYLVATNDDLSHSRSGGNLGSGSGSTQRFGAADVYHMWLEVVPAPSGVALAGLAGLAGVRRRR